MNPNSNVPQKLKERVERELKERCPRYAYPLFIQFVTKSWEQSDNPIREASIFINNLQENVVHKWRDFMKNHFFPSFREKMRDSVPKKFPDYQRHTDYVDFLMRLVERDENQITKAKELSDAVNKLDCKVPPYWLEYLEQKMQNKNLFQRLEAVRRDNELNQYVEVRRNHMRQHIEQAQAKRLTQEEEHKLNNLKKHAEALPKAVSYIHRQFYLEFEQNQTQISFFNWLEKDFKDYKIRKSSQQAHPNASHQGPYQSNQQYGGNNSQHQNNVNHSYSPYGNTNRGGAPNQESHYSSQQPRNEYSQSQYGSTQSANSYNSTQNTNGPSREPTYQPSPSNVNHNQYRGGGGPQSNGQSYQNRQPLQQSQTYNSTAGYSNYSGNSRPGGGGGGYENHHQYGRMNEGNNNRPTQGNVINTTASPYLSNTAGTPTNNNPIEQPSSVGGGGMNNNNSSYNNNPSDNDWLNTESPLDMISYGNTNNGNSSHVGSSNQKAYPQTTHTQANTMQMNRPTNHTANSYHHSNQNTHPYHPPNTTGNNMGYQRSNTQGSGNHHPTHSNNTRVVESPHHSHITSPHHGTPTHNPAYGSVSSPYHSTPQNTNHNNSYNTNTTAHPNHNHHQYQQRTTTHQAQPTRPPVQNTLPSMMKSSNPVIEHTKHQQYPGSHAGTDKSIGSHMSYQPNSSNNASKPTPQVQQMRPEPTHINEMQNKMVPEVPQSRPSSSYFKVIEKKEFRWSLDIQGFGGDLNDAKNDNLQSIYKQLKNPFGDEQLTDFMKKEVENDLFQSKQQLFSSQDSVQKKVRPNPEPVKETNMIAEPKPNSQPNSNPSTAPKVPQQDDSHFFTSELTALKNDQRFKVYPKDVGYQGIELTVYQNNGSWHDKIVLKVNKNNAPRIKIIEMARVEDFITDFQEPLDFALQNGKLIQILDLWLQFLDKCEKEATNKLNEFDDMFA